MASRRRVAPQVAGPLPGGKAELTADDLKDGEAGAGGAAKAPGATQALSSSVGTAQSPGAPEIQAEPPAEAGGGKGAEAVGSAGPSRELVSQEGSGEAEAATPAEDAATEIRLEDPPEGASVAEKLRFYHDRIRPARDKWVESQDKADAVFAEEAGYPLWCVLKQGLHLELQNDQNNGECFKNAKEYLDVVWGIKKATGYRLLARIPVLQALGNEIDSETRRSLSVRQVAVLASVAQMKDPKAAELTRMIWRATVATGQATPDRLKHYREQILAGTKWEDLELFESAPKPASTTVVQKLDKMLTKVNTTELIAVARQDPERAKEVADYLRPILTALDTAVGAVPAQPDGPAALEAAVSEA